MFPMHFRPKILFYEFPPPRKIPIITIIVHQQLWSNIVHCRDTPKLRISSGDDRTEKIYTTNIRIIFKPYKSISPTDVNIFNLNKSKLNYYWNLVRCRISDSESPYRII